MVSVLLVLYTANIKARDSKHAEWVKLYTAILIEQQAYIKEYHTAGLVWNPKVYIVDVQMLNFI